MRIEDVARVTHEANRIVQELTGDPAVSPPWDQAPEWQRTSAINGVNNAIDGGVSPEESHENWCDEKYADGWVYGPVKDAEKKTHPCLVAYGDLPPEQLVKDELFIAIVGALAPLVE